MDWAGVCILGCVTALGGGTLRGVVLQHYPLAWVQNPSHLALTAIAAYLTIPIARLVHRLNAAFLALDAIGLVVFTMAGCDVAWDHGLCRRGAARHPLQRGAASLSLWALRQRLGRHRTVLRHRLRVEAER